jgi:hypothetical protein
MKDLIPKNRKDGILISCPASQAEIIDAPK